MCTFRYAVMVLLLIVVGTVGVRGQVADGVYYIQYSGNNYYLWPTAPTSNGWPCLTTFSGTSVPETGLSYNFGAFDSSYCTWIVVTDENDNNYQNIINARFGKYVIWLSNGNAGRNVVLEDNGQNPTTGQTRADNTHAQFKITGTGSQILIKPYTGSNSFNNKGDHQNYITSYNNGDSSEKKGLLQFYSSNNQWKFS